MEVITRMEVIIGVAAPTGLVIASATVPLATRVIWSWQACCSRISIAYASQLIPTLTAYYVPATLVVYQ